MKNCLITKKIIEKIQWNKTPIKKKRVQRLFTFPLWIISLELYTSDILNHSGWY